MSDGREQREEQEKRREWEKREDQDRNRRLTPSAGENDDWDNEDDAG